MCGYTVLLSKNNFEINSKILNKLKNFQNHRGPDSSNYIKLKNIYFFHNRLKILDLSNKANQPFVSKSSKNIIVYNGEIYNYREIAKEFLPNEEFLTNSDTEVILKLYDRYGRKIFEKLNGIFSFIIYDYNKNEIISCRDRFGIKPLYYFEDNEKLVFSTEIKPILFINNRIDFNFKIINQYINVSLLHHNKNTFFKNIFCQNSSTVKIYSNTNKKFTKSYKYWKLTKKNNLICKNFKEYVETYNYYFLNSLKLNLVSDVDVGLLLSSGLDSRYIYQNLKNNNINNLHTFTFGWKNKNYSEIEKLLKYTKIPNKIFHSKVINFSNFFNKLEKMTFYNEGPIGGFGTYGMFELLSLVKNKNIKVLLTGEGSDEFNLGYLNHHAAFLKEIIKEKQFKEELYSFNKKYNFNLNIKKIINKFVTNSIYAPDGTDMSKKNYGISTNIDEIIKNYSFSIKLPKLLSFMDKSGGAHGIETRFPFLDHNLVEFTYSNPSKFKIIKGRTKANLASFLSDKSSGKLFVATPQREYIKQNYKLILDYIYNGSLQNLMQFKFKDFENDFMDYVNNKSLGNSFFVWKFINLESFFRNFENLDS